MLCNCNLVEKSGGNLRFPIRWVGEESKSEVTHDYVRVLTSVLAPRASEFVVTLSGKALFEKAAVASFSSHGQ